MLPTLRRWARRRAANDDEADEAFGVGLEALAKRVTTYDPAHPSGASLSTYCYPNITTKIRKRLQIMRRRADRELSLDGLQDDAAPGEEQDQADAIERLRPLLLQLSTIHQWSVEVYLRGLDAEGAERLAIARGIEYKPRLERAAYTEAVKRLRELAARENHAEG